MSVFRDLIISQKLPNLYQEVEYIGNVTTTTGFVVDSRAIDTGVIFNEGTIDIELKIANCVGQQNFIGTNHNTISSYTTKDYSGFRTYFGNSGTTTRAILVSNNSSLFSNYVGILNQPSIYKMSCDENYLVTHEWNGDATSATFSNIHNNRSIYILSTHQENDECIGGGAKRLYYAKIWRNGILVRDYIPVQRKADKVYGLWDKVQHKFYGEKDGKSLVGGDPI